jgi:cytochrome b561
MSRTTTGPTTVEVYSRTARALHWATVALLAAQIPVGLYMAYRGGTLNTWDAVTNTLYTGHKLGGVVILALVIWRIGYRLARGAPTDEPTITPWQRAASHATHWTLYGLLVAVPVAGYVGVSLFPALDIFGLFSLPAVTAPDKEAAKAALGVHRLLAMLLVAVLAVHVAAALYHHLVRKDDVLGRMIPRLIRR